MNIKKSFFCMALSIFIMNAHLAYTKDLQDDNINNVDAAIALNDHNKIQNQYNSDQWKQIEETFQTICDQTCKIEFCLQQTEQILNSNKIKLDTQKVSKHELLQETKEIKEIIHMLFEFYSTSMQKDDAIVKGTLFNACFIDYLLPIMHNDITQLNAQKFDACIAEKFNDALKSLQSEDQLMQIIQKNKINLDLLMKACDTIGLTTFNKIYRYLDTKKLPLYGKSTIDTACDIAFWGTIATVAIIFATYMTPKNLPFPVLNIEQGQFPTISSIKFKEFSIKKKIGDFNEKLRELKGNILPDELVDIQKNSSIVSHIHGFCHAHTDPFSVTTLGALGYFTLPYFKDLYKKTTQQCQNFFTYYVKGDATPAKNSNDFTKAYFKDLVGMQHVEQLAHELADYLKNPTRYERCGIAPSNGYLFVGPSRTGKSEAAKAIKTVIEKAFEGTNEKIKFFSISQDDVDYFKGFANLFYEVRKNAPVVLFMDEIDMFNVRRGMNSKSTQELLTAMNGIDTDPSKKVIVIAATNRPEELDFALTQKGRFGDIITFDVPTYEQRTEYINKQLSKKNIPLQDTMIEKIAQETHGHTFSMIDAIIKHANRLSVYQTRPVQEADFEIALDREIRKIKPTTNLCASEKELVAIYHAGQAAARHILSTDQKIVKITIDEVDKPLKPKEGFDVINEEKGQHNENHDLLLQSHKKQTRLGSVFTISTTNNQDLLSDAQQEKELLALICGQVALELIKGSTFNEFGKEDRAKILDKLEKKISQGNPITDKIRLQAIAQKDALYHQAKLILQDHISFVQTITDQLIAHHNINQKEWLTLTANYIVS